MARETSAQAIARRQRERQAMEERERGQRRPAPAPASSRNGGAAGTGEAFTGALRDLGPQAWAAVRGAQDSLTFGYGDRLNAGGGALLDAYHGADLGQAWQARMAAERARDQYDAQHFRAARTAGQIAGAGAGLLALGPVDAALAGGVRIAEATPMLAREAAVLTGAGAAGGLANQGLADLKRRHLGTAGDYAGSALGGGVTALAATRGAPSQAGALGGAVSSAAQDLLNGRSIDWGDASSAALASAAFAAGAGRLAHDWSDALHFTDKGRLGEAMGRVRTLANGDIPLPGRSRIPVKSGAKTVADHVTKSGKITEQKFGPSARLSPNQRAAYNEYGDRYRVDNFLPRDVGAAVATPFAFLGYQAPARDRSR